MKIENVIQTKGHSSVITIAPAASVRDLVALLTEHNIGAVVVSSDGQHIEGIASERDVVRQLAARGATLLDATVADLMTTQVRTAEPEMGIEDAASLMTEHRVRHMPVLVDGQLAGIVSIGDVVKHRMAQLTDERNHLMGYLHQ